MPLSSSADHLKNAEVSSAWSPLRDVVFRSLWIATLVSNIGTWMQNVGAAWLMTTLTPSPLTVALVQAATSLPVFLVALPAGALADLVDRRRFLIITELWMLAVAAVLGLLAILNAVTPGVLLALTFALGLGAAMNIPAWQATLPELASKADLKNAITLNGVSFNIARAVGPALGGIVIATAGVGSVFLLNAVSFLAVVVALLRWNRIPKESPSVPERLIGAMRAGFRYMVHAPALRAVLIRAAVFALGASGLFALLPVRVKEIQFGANGYGFLLGCLGAGASMGVFLLPSARRVLSPDGLAAIATIVFAICTLGLALSDHATALSAAMLIAGVAWIVQMSTLNSAAQTVVPAWVKGRALSFYLLMFQGGLAAGSTVWGWLAGRGGIALSLAGAAAFIVIGLSVTFRYRLAAAEGLDHTPTLHWPAPELVVVPSPDDGPVLISVEYRVIPESRNEFVAAMNDLRSVRLRDGAISWQLYRDTADSNRYVEEFMVESWSEHLRQHERVTAEDRKLEDRVRSYHIGPAAPAVRHLVGVTLATEEQELRQSISQKEV